MTACLRIPEWVPEPADDIDAFWRLAIWASRLPWWDSRRGLAGYYLLAGFLPTAARFGP